MPQKRKRFIMDSDEDPSDGETSAALPAAAASVEEVVEEAEEADEEAWQFDCVCGVSGTNVDDGTEMVQCGDPTCGLWYLPYCR